MNKTSSNLSRRGFLQTTGVAALAASLVVEAQSIAAETKSNGPQPDKKKIRMGIVGGGFGASFQWHLDPNCVVEAVSDLRPDRRDKLQKVYKCRKSYESLEKLILDPKIDAVAVFSGAPDHARHMIDCMRHGKHVVSAVPACFTLEEAAAMKATKEKTGLKYMMAETSYYRAPTIFARKVWAEGVFGDFLFSEVEYYHSAKSKKYMAGLEKKKNDGLFWRDGKKTWRYGLPPMLYPTHSTGFHVGVTGERMTQVSCHGWGPDFAMYKPDANVYDNLFRNSIALFKTDRGNVSRCNVCWQINAGGERAQWLGETAALYMKSCGGQPFAYQRQGKPAMNTQPSYLHLLPEPMRVSCGHGNSHTFLTHEFISALVEDREPAVDICEALAMTVPGIVANQSARRDGEQLKIPCFDKA